MEEVQPHSSPETKESNFDCAASGSWFSFTSDDSEDDNDDLNSTDAITFPQINLESIDDIATPQNNGK